MLPASTAAKAESLSFTPEQEHGNAEGTDPHQDPDQQPLQIAQDASKQSKAVTAQADSTSEEMDIDVVCDGAPTESTSAK